MIYDIHIASYLRSVASENEAFLRKIEEDAIKNGVPIIRKEMESFLRVMLDMLSPQNILELGTATGYSSLLMATHLKKSGKPFKITTVENFEPRFLEASKNIKAAGFFSEINIIKGDALEVLDNLNDKYQFVFMDAAKAQYVNYLPKVIKLMDEGSALITDNVLLEGDLTLSRFVNERRDRTIHARMREYIDLLIHNENLSTTLIPIGDGITLSYKKD